MTTFNTLGLGDKRATKNNRHAHLSLYELTTQSQQQNRQK